MSDFQPYRRKQIAELRPWKAGDDMSRVSMSVPDREAGSPKPGDMIARNPKNHNDQWLVAAKYFADNFEPASTLTEPAPGMETTAEERARWSQASGLAWLGDEDLGRLLRDIDRLLAERTAIIAIADGLANTAAQRHARPDGKTIIDFMRLWLEQARDDVTKAKDMSLNLDALLRAARTENARLREALKWIATAEVEVFDADEQAVVIVSASADEMKARALAALAKGLER